MSSSQNDQGEPAPNSSLKSKVMSLEQYVKLLELKLVQKEQELSDSKAIVLFMEDDIDKMQSNLATLRLEALRLQDQYAATSNDSSSGKNSTANYKLTYFRGRGFVEPIRQVFRMAEVEFDEDILTPDDKTWENLKKNVPFGQLPVLNADGIEIPQSAAILRYVSKKFGLAGKSPEEEAWCDAIIDRCKDFVVTFRQVYVAARQNKPAEEIEKIRKEVSEPARERFFEILNDVLAQSTSGFLVGDEVTFADLFIVDNLLILERNGIFHRAEQPKLTALMQKVHNLPNLRNHIESLSKTSL
ncbi:unnamed protein product [Caenorhabditis angaria]|uniref:glutathione transferase n=1 Tax=Caenorhabditis angaria TaxID=860376 RepID=A0A9P1IJ99_9PELO|nr:unnamed protein product [Caenorhabditis angaria]